MKKTLAFIVAVFLTYLIMADRPITKRPATVKPGKPLITAIRPPSHSERAINFQNRPPLVVKSIALAMNDPDFLQYPLTITASGRIFTLSRGGSTHGDFLVHDDRGSLIQNYNQKGHGPGELSEPSFFSVHGEEIFISERGRPTIHFLDTSLSYKKQQSFRGVGYVVFTTDTLLGVWGYRQHSARSQAGHMLTLIERDTGKAVQNLVPVHKTLFSLFNSGSAVLNGDTIYAIAANTGMIDIIDCRDFKTTRLNPLDGLRLSEPVSWRKWSAKNKKHKSSTRGMVRTWQATFAIPVDITVVNGRLIVLYAKGEQYFYDQRSLEGALISSNHQVPIPHPTINGSRLEGISVDENDRQHYAYIDLRGTSDPTAIQ